MPKPSLTPEDLSALRAVGETGGRRAALALSQLIGSRVSVQVSDVAVVGRDDVAAALHQGDEIVAGLRFRFFGGARGTILLVFPEISARGFIARLAPQAEEGAAGEHEDSVLREIGNILASAYLSAMGDRCSLVLIPSVPALVFDRGSSVVEHLAEDLCGEADGALLITTRFTDATGEATGKLFLIPDAPSLDLVIRAIRTTEGQAR